LRPLGDDQIDELLSSVLLDAVSAGEPTEPSYAIQIVRVVHPGVRGLEGRPLLPSYRKVPQRTTGGGHLEVDQGNDPTSTKYGVLGKQIVVAYDRSARRVGPLVGPRELGLRE
jgi:hypothetical protein